MPNKLSLASRFFSLIFLALLSAAARGQEAVSARALAMGGAFTAIAEGSGGVNWNPAAAANVRRSQFFWPGVAVQARGALGIGDLVKGVPSDWNSRLQSVRKWSNGVTNGSVAGYTGYATPDYTLSLSGFGRGTLTPTDFDGTVGKLTLSQNFSLAALHDATVAVYKQVSYSQANAEKYANKVVALVQKTYPGATTIALPAYKAHIEAQGDVYGAFSASVGQHTTRNVSLGLNLKMVAAEHLTGYARFDKNTFTQKAAEVTDGTSSPAMTDRILRALNLTLPNGDYFAGGNTAGDVAWGQKNSGLEIRPSLDFGTLWRPAKRMQIGLVVANLVPAHFGSAAPLNTYLNVGAAYGLPRQHVLLAADLTHLLDSQAARASAGLEWAPNRYYTLRAGVSQGRLTYGFGIGGGFSLALTPGMSLLSLGAGF